MLYVREFSDLSEHIVSLNYYFESNKFVWIERKLNNSVKIDVMQGLSEKKFPTRTRK